MTRTFTAIAAALAATLAAPAAADPVRDATAKAMPDLIALYRDLHANPELPARK